MLNTLTGFAALAQSSQSKIITIYSDPGWGKTTFALSATCVGKTLFIDTENSAAKVWSKVPCKSEDNLVVPQEQFDVQKLCNLVSTPEGREWLMQFDLLVVDSITDCVDNWVRSRKRQTGKKNIQIQDWGEMGGYFDDFMSFCQTYGINILMTVHSEQKDDNDGSKYHRPKTQGNKVAELLIRKSDAILYGGFTDNGERALYTQPNDIVDCIAKHRGNAEVMYIAPTYETIHNTFDEYEVKPISKKEVKELDTLLEENNALKEIDMPALFLSMQMKEKKFSDFIPPEYMRLKSALETRLKHIQNVDGE